MERSRKEPVWSDGPWEHKSVRRNMNRRGSLDQSYGVVEHHNNIINRYNIVNGCLKLIRPSRIGTVQKLKIETMLIRVKILLLDETGPHPLLVNSSGDAPFEAVLEQVREVSEGDCSDQSLARLTERVAALLSSLGSDPEGFGAKPM